MQPVEMHATSCSTTATSYSATAGSQLVWMQATCATAGNHAGNQYNCRQPVQLQATMQATNTTAGNQCNRPGHQRQQPMQLPEPLQQSYSSSTHMHSDAHDSISSMQNWLTVSRMAITTQRSHPMLHNPSSLSRWVSCCQAPSPLPAPIIFSQWDWGTVLQNLEDLRRL